MFFYGIKSKSIKKGVLSHVTCPYCHEESDMEFDFRQKYFHLYLIPLIPLQKKVTVYCEKCHITIEKKQFSNSIQQKLNRVKERYPIRTPVWAFSGVIILVLFFTWAVWQSGRHDVTEGEYIKNPKKGDVYFIESHPGGHMILYSTMRIDKVHPDKVFVTFNDTSTTKYTKVFGILDERYYTHKKGVYTRKKIQELYKKDSIISITRK